MLTWGKKNIRLLVLLTVVIVFIALLPICSAHAAASSSPPTSPGFLDLIKDPALFIAWQLYIFLEAFGVVLAICAAFLNQVVSFSILGFHDFVTALTSINIAWQLIRDLLNIVFIFVLLFIGINTILGSWSNSSLTTKLIPKVIIAAVLINFSLFFTKVIIDASNIVSIELYHATQRLDEPFIEDGILKETPGLAGAMMNNLHLAGFFNGKLSNLGSGPDADTTVDASHHIIVSSIMAIIVVLVACFVFLAMAFMLLGRFIIFIILMITSPIAFMGEILPQLRPQAGKWWNALLGQAFFAPVFFTLLLVTFLVLNDPHFHDYGFGVTGGGYAAAYIGGGIATFVRYFVALFLLVSSLIIAKTVSDNAGKGVADFAGKWAGKAVFGGVAALGANTVGRLGSAISQSSVANSLQASQATGLRGIGARLVGRGLIQTGNYFGGASYDVRGADWAKQLGAGKAAPGFEQRKKAEEDRVKKAVDKLESRGAATAEEVEKLRAEIEKVPDAIKELETQIENYKKIIEDRETTDKEKTEARAGLDIAQAQLETQRGTLDKLRILEKQNPDIQKEEKRKAEGEIARLARNLSSSQIRLVQTITNEADADRRGRMRATLGVEEEKLAKAIDRLSSAQKNLGDAKKATQLEWANRAAGRNGAIGAVADNIRKDLNKSRGRKIMEDFLSERSGGEKEKEKSGGDDKAKS